MSRLSNYKEHKYLNGDKQQVDDTGRQHLTHLCCFLVVLRLESIIELKHVYRTVITSNEILAIATIKY